MSKVNPKVTLIAHTPEPEKTISLAAKLCYSSLSIDELEGNLTPEKCRSFLEMLSDLGHQSPVEHVSFTFGIEGVSRSFLAQITRHRIASFSVQSQRYVKEQGIRAVVPPEIEKDSSALKIFNEAMDNAINSYNALADILEKKHYAELVSNGMSEKQARSKAEKMAIEDARFVLPNASETKMIVTMNARSLMHFFELRCCNRAQWEIREVADQMFSLVYSLAPTLFKDAGPGCLRGKCPEGKMSCGKSKEMRELFDKLKEI